MIMAVSMTPITGCMLGDSSAPKPNKVDEARAVEVAADPIFGEAGTYRAGFSHGGMMEYRRSSVSTYEQIEDPELLKVLQDPSHEYSEDEIAANSSAVRWRIAQDDAAGLVEAGWALTAVACYPDGDVTMLALKRFDDYVVALRWANMLDYSFDDSHKTYWYVIRMGDAYIPYHIEVPSPWSPSVRIELADTCLGADAPPTVAVPLVENNYTDEGSKDTLADK